MRKTIINGLLLIGTVLITGCQSNQKIQNTYRYDSFEKTTGMTFSATNLSAIHAPPLMTGLAYIEIYDKTAFCLKNRKPLGEVSISKENNTQRTKLPVGEVVVKVGINAIGFDGSGLACNKHFGFNAKEGFEYEVTITESRPLVTSCYFSIKQKGPEGSYTPLGSITASEDKLFNLIEDMSNICGG